SVSALLLVVIAAARAKRMPRLAKGVLPYLWTGALIATVLIYVGGVPLGVVQHLLPFLKSNFIGRLRSVLGLLLAALAAVGFKAIPRECPGPGTGRGREASIWVLFGVGAVLAYRAAWRLAGEVGQRGYLLRHSILPALAGGVTLLAIALGARVTIFDRP